jgi:hypothetical protein
LYFDELLVGTGTGLYGHIGKSGAQGFNLIDNEIVLYPNPNTGEFKIKLNKKYNDIELSVYNAMGTRVYLSNYNNKSEIDFNSALIFAKGMYYINIKADDKEFKTKLLIEK